MPAVASYALPYWEAFACLSERRAWNDGYPAFIPLSEILAYATYHGVNDEWEREMMLHMLQVLDRQYVNYKAEIAKKKAEEEARKAKQRGRQR